MILAEYEKKFDNKRKIHANGSIYMEMPSDQTSEARYALWNLDDFIVSSASFPIVWLTERN